MSAAEAEKARAALALMVFHGPSEAFGGLASYRFRGAEHVRAVNGAGFVVRCVDYRQETYHAISNDASPFVRRLWLTQRPEA